MSKSKKRPRPKRPRQFEPLRKKLEQNLGRNIQIVTGPKGQVKMSDVLKDFVEPFVHSAPTEEAYRRLLTLAVLAWNISFLPEDEQEGKIDDILADLLEGDRQLKKELKEFILALIIRKKLFFADYTRQIIDFELVDQGENYHLSVVSTLEEADDAHH